jgi:NADH dehydrogenase/NADH:ubiquinone oxidoreductase subunit G
VDVRGNEVLRVLPRVGLDEEWISDKIRFSYDALILNRVTTPFVRISNKFERVSWRRAHLFLLRAWLKGVGLTKALPELSFFYGFAVDLETLLLSFLFRTRFFLFRFAESINSFASRSAFMVNLKGVKFIFLSCFNPRYEVPILNLTMRRLVRANSLSVASFGLENDLTYYHVNLGFSLKSLLLFLSFKHPVYRFLRNKSNWLFLMGFSSFIFNAGAFWIRVYRDFFFFFTKVG